MVKPIRFFALATIVGLGCTSGGGERAGVTTAADSDQDHDQGCSGEDDDDHDNNGADRDAAAQSVEWGNGKFNGQEIQNVKLLAINDFHGQITTGKTTKVSGVPHPVGGAPVLAAYLRAAQAGAEDYTIFTHSGDLVGAGPAASGILLDEPAIMFMNLFANESCSNEGGADTKKCNVIGTLGNHEFDKGKAELLRKIYGGNAATGPYLQDPWAGASFPYVCANVVDKATGKTLLPPYQIAQVHGEKIAFIGAVTKNTPTVVVPSAVSDVTFLDEADAINSYIPEIQAQNVHAIVVLIHEGGAQNPYVAPPAPPVTGRITTIIPRLDDDIDVVLSGHSHKFTNALLPTASGKQILVTQAFSSGTAFANIDLKISRETKDVVYKSAKIVSTFADSGPGLTPDAQAKALLDAALAKAGPLLNVVEGSTTVALTGQHNEIAGESNLGDLIADAQRQAMGTSFALMNPGGIRTDLPIGPITYGALFGVQPFANNLVAMNITGAQLKTALEQQFINQPSGPQYLQISGFSYTWDAALPTGSRVVSMLLPNGAAIDPNATYSLTANSFLAGGGDNFTILAKGTSRVNGPIDLDALVAYVKQLGTISITVSGRSTRLH